MREAMKQVTAFHIAMDQPVRSPDAIDLGRRTLRFELIREEVDELRAALEASDVTAVADALADISYVVVGAAVEWGIPLAEVFDEVHRSNMAKVGGPVRADGKRLKPPGWTPPDVAGVIRRAATGMIKRPIGCRCHLEIGDSACSVEGHAPEEG